MIALLAALALTARTSASAPPLVTGTQEQALAVISAAWSSRGGRPFARSPQHDPSSSGACTDDGLCILLTGAAGLVRSVTLTGPARSRQESAHYLSAQSLLVRMTAPGASMLPVVTADRIAVSSPEPAEAQLGPTCMRVQRGGAGVLSTAFSQRQCEVGPPPSLPPSR